MGAAMDIIQSFEAGQDRSRSLAAQKLQGEQQQLAFQQQQEDRSTEQDAKKGEKLKLMVTGMLSAYKHAKQTGDQEYVKAYYQQMKPYLQEFAKGKPIPQEWDEAEQLPNLLQLAAKMGLDAAPQQQAPQKKYSHIRETPKGAYGFNEQTQAWEPMAGGEAISSDKGITDYQAEVLANSRLALSDRVAAREEKAAIASQTATDKVGKEKADRDARLTKAINAPIVNDLSKVMSSSNATMASLDKLEAAINAGAELGPIASRSPLGSYRDSTLAAEQAVAEITLSKVKLLTGPASDKDVVFLNKVALAGQDEKAIKKQLPEIRKAIVSLHNKAVRLSTLLADGMNYGEAYKEVYGMMPESMPEGAAPASVAPAGAPATIQKMRVPANVRAVLDAMKAQER